MFAYSSECSHLGVDVTLPNQDGLLMCTSGDGGTYDIYGRTLGPPAPENLKGYTAIMNENTVEIYDISPDTRV
jgi:Rieske Fe-S protein